MDAKSTSIISYITFIGWLIAYCSGDKEGAKFHLNQSLVILIANLILTGATRMVNILFQDSLLRIAPSILLTVCNLFLFLCWLIGFIAACQNKETEVPVLGSIRILK